jgi:hypothetical protein
MTKKELTRIKRALAMVPQHCCGYINHRKHEQNHPLFDKCPAEARMEKTIAEALEVVKKYEEANHGKSISSRSKLC